MKKEKKIIVDVKVKGLIKEAKLGSYPTIKKALDGNANTPQMIRIREKALKLGGIESKL